MIDQTIFYLALPLKIITRKLSIPDSDASAQCSVFKWRLHLWTSTFMIHHSVNCHRWQLGGTYSQRGRWKKQAEISVDKDCGKTWQNEHKIFLFYQNIPLFRPPFPGLDWIDWRVLVSPRKGKFETAHFCHPPNAFNNLLIETFWLVSFLKETVHL